MSLQDPFYLVKEEVQQSLSGLNALYERWKDLLETSNTADNDEFDWTKNELLSQLKNIDNDLADMDETVQIVARNLDKFKLDGEELEQRKRN